MIKRRKFKSEKDRKLARRARDRKYKKKLRANKDSSYYLNRSRGPKKWTIGILDDLLAQQHVKTRYSKLNLWEIRLANKLKTHFSSKTSDSRLIFNSKKMNPDIAFNNWIHNKKRKHLKFYSNV